MFALPCGAHDVVDDLPIRSYGTIGCLTVCSDSGTSAFCQRLLTIGRARTDGLGEIERVFRSDNPANIFFFQHQCRL